MVDRVGGPGRVPVRRTLTPILRRGIAGQTLAFGLFGILSTLTAQGPDGVWGKTITYLVCATTIPASIAVGRARFDDNWWTRSSRAHNAFVIYAELGVTAVLLTFADAELALVAASLLALVGACAAHLCPRRVLRFHLVWGSAIVITLVCRILLEGGHDTVGTVLRGLVVILVMNGAVFLLSAFSADVVTSSRLHLADAVTDPLTGLLNRRGIESHAATALERGSPASCLVLLDVDDFKQVNDTHGHAAGDEVLRAVAMRLMVSAGSGAVVSRFGGEEFVVLVTDPQPDLATYSERLRACLTDPDDEIPITASAGASPPAAESGVPVAGFAHTLAAADLAMYRAKTNGRGRTELA